MTSPEASSAYLERSRFKTLMEWLTARCILHRPDDPMVFCRDLLDRKIQLRGGKSAPYDPQCASRLLKECYDDAMNSADEHGVIHSDACVEPATGRNELPSGSTSATSKYVATPGNKAAPSDSSISKTRSLREDSEGREHMCREETSPISTGGASKHTFLEALEELFEVARPEIAASGVVASICKIVNAGRAALFKVVDEAGALREIGVGASSEPRLVKPGQGLVGKAATAGEPAPAVLVPEPSEEEAFCPEVDMPRDPRSARATSGRPPQLMYGVLKNASGGVWGVLVVADPAGGGGTFDDETLLTFGALCNMVAVAMRNAEALELGERGCEKFRNMVEVMEATSSEHLGVYHLLYKIAKCLPMICDAQKCTCFLVDGSRNELRVVQGEVNMRAPMSKGIVGAVATSGKVENISDVYADPRFNKEVDAATGFQTHSILAIPVRGGEDNRVISVVQLINKQAPGYDARASRDNDAAAVGKHFTAHDEVVIGSFLSLFGPHIFHSSVMKFKKKVNTVGDREQEAVPDRHMDTEQKSTVCLSNLLDAGRSLAEEEEDEDDENGEAEDYRGYGTSFDSE